MELSRAYPIDGRGLLYPMMWIAAIAVIVFSIVGIASMTGWMPQSLVSSGTTTLAAESDGSTPERAAGEAQPELQRTGPAFQCAECGVIDSIREIERRGSLWGAPLATAAPAQSAAVTGL